MNESDIAVTIVLITLIILILIAGLTISFFAISRQRAKQKILLTEAKLQYEHELRKVEAELGEHMMQQFARELHDNLGHIITCLKLEIENVKLEGSGVADRLSKADAHLKEASSHIRLLSRSLNTDYLKNIGLAEAIALEVQRLNALGKFKINWEHDGNPGVTKDRQLMIFRIFQEVATNALRHSGASEFSVTLDSDPFRLRLKDNGIGFNLNGMRNSGNASGVSNIIKRSEMANLTCSIITAPDEGCEYILKENNKNANTNE